MLPVRLEYAMLQSQEMRSGSHWYFGDGPMALDSIRTA